MVKRRRRRKGKGNKKILKIILCFIGILLALFIGVVIYEVVQDFGQEDILKQEIINYSNKNLVSDDYTIYVKTKGDYAYIEEAVKKFYKELSDNVKIINYYMADEELINILAPDNLIKERPNYTNSFSIIDKDRNKVINALKRISKLCEKDTIENLIDKDKVDDYSYKLYKDLMLSKKDIEELKETKDKMEYLAKNLNLFFDKEVELLNFLKANDASWQYTDNQLLFTSTELANKYNALFNDLKEIAKKFESDGATVNSGGSNKVEA
ncbi:MAG: hypothetical protein VZS44_02655 [Bacilli bacterium]|nr:hypothetical protein [Bacilli bacterium]